MPGTIQARTDDDLHPTMDSSTTELRKNLAANPLKYTAIEIEHEPAFEVQVISHFPVYRYSPTDL